MHLGEPLPTEHPTCARSRRTTGCRRTLPSGWTALQDMYTGRCKVTGFTDPTANRQLERQITTHRTSPEGTPRVTADKTPKTDFVVTPDPRRAPFTPEEFMQAHLDRASPAGPRGNGFTPENVAGKTGYYTFEIAPGVVGIALDSTNRAGFAGGSIGQTQYRWLERTLRAGSSHWYDDVGTRRNHAADDTLFLVFSHHTPDSMNNLLLESDAPYSGDSPATLYREYSFNDIHAGESNAGADADHNTELLLVNPLS